MQFSANSIFKYITTSILLVLVVNSTVLGQATPTLVLGQATPTLTSPSSGSSFSSNISVSLTIPESYASGSVNLKFINTGTGGTYSNTLTLANTIIASQTFTFTLNTTNLLSSTGLASSTYNTLPDGTYSVALSYQDISFHPSTPVTNTNVLIQTVTPTPIIISPASTEIISSTSTPTFTYRLPSTPKSGSAYLTINPGGYSYPLTNATSAGTYSYSITSSIPPDGTYTSTVSYMDFLENPVASASISFVFDRNTLSPTITSPFTNGVTTGTITLTYNTPEAALAGTKKITISQL